MILIEIIFDTLFFKICCRKKGKNVAVEQFLHESQKMTVACLFITMENRAFDRKPDLIIK